MGYTLHTDIKAKSISYGGLRPASAIKYLVYHYTGNRNDSAVANAKYFRDTNTRSAGAHYFVDATSVYQSIDDLRIAWSVGGNKYSDCKTTGGGTMYKIVTNTNSISIEMCSTNSEISKQTMENAAALGKVLMQKYNIPITNVYTHFDVTGKKCVGWNGWWGTDRIKWNQFKAMLSSDAYTPPIQSLSPSNTPTSQITQPLKITSTKKDIQKYLNTYYEIGLIEDGIFGEKSKKAITIAIQKELNKLGAQLTIDGDFGMKSQTAWDKYVGTIKNGSKGIFVTLWQCLLVGFGYDIGGIDGIFGANSAKATNLLFSKYKITQDSNVSGSDINKIL